jgi:hypothetical protein
MLITDGAGATSLFFGNVFLPLPSATAKHPTYTTTQLTSQLKGLLRVSSVPPQRAICLSSEYMSLTEQHTGPIVAAGGKLGGGGATCEPFQAREAPAAKFLDE